MKKFMTLEEFEAEAQKKQAVLVLYKDKVLDLTQFARQHPGGSNHIYRHVGAEVSQLIFEDGPGRHKHSRKVVSRLLEYQVGVVVGSLAQDEPQDNLQEVLTLFKSIVQQKIKKAEPESNSVLEPEEEVTTHQIPFFLAKPSHTDQG